MTSPVTTKIGFIRPTASNTPHYDAFKRIVPAGVDLDMQDLSIIRDRLEEFGGRLDDIVGHIKELVAVSGWEGVIVPGAPVEVQNPGFFEALAKAVDIPFNTALSACVDALKAIGAERVLFLTPFDERMNSLIAENVARSGIQASFAELGFSTYTDARGLGPEDVLRAAGKALHASSGAQAVYFQGAILDPLAVLDRMEAELGTTVLASNPVMLWSILSKLGKRFEISGVGSLLKTWPAITA